MIRWIFQTRKLNIQCFRKKDRKKRAIDKQNEEIEDENPLGLVQYYFRLQAFSLSICAIK